MCCQESTELYFAMDRFVLLDLFNAVFSILHGNGLRIVVWSDGHVVPLSRVQTGAGKTFTMSGDLRHYQHRGLIPQAIHHVFREIDMRVDKMYTVHVSCDCAVGLAGAEMTSGICPS